MICPRSLRPPKFKQGIDGMRNRTNHVAACIATMLVAGVLLVAGSAQASVVFDFNDGTHFDSASQRELGRRYADALLSLE